jgi:GNAT superfamily N-acetyltransferase
MPIRDATSDDASPACIVLRRSITELCAADHRNDPAILARWLSNKTEAIFCQWLAQPGNSVLVAVEDGVLAAVGSVTDQGMVTLAYVSPDFRFRGVSKALLAALEARAAARGNDRCTLTSTATALRFYRANGYVETGPAEGAFGTTAGYPMLKRLRA